MKRITQLVLPGNLEIDLLFENGKLGYSFEHDGQFFGNAVKLPSKRVEDIAAVSLQLFANALETKQALEKKQ